MRMIQFQACIELRDIKDVNLLDVPDPESMNDSSTLVDHFQTDFYIQLVLKGLGSTKVDFKKNDQIKKIREKNEAIALIFFKLNHQVDEKKKIEFIIEKIKEYQSENIKDDKIQSFTNVPFYDLNTDSDKEKRE